MKHLQWIFLLFLSLLSIARLVALPNRLVHVIGDSHSSEFSQIPDCIIHWVGPITMNRVGRDKLDFLYLPKFGVNEAEIVVFTFGEIDVRCHIGKQCDLHKRDLDEVIHTLASNYINTILLNRNLYADLTCVVYSVTPPTDAFFSPEYPFYGLLNDRINITEKLNTNLLNLCQANNILFLDVYDDYANPDKSLNTSLSDGTVHIHPQFFQAIQHRLYLLLAH